MIGMDGKESEETAYPSWLPAELKEYVLDYRKKYSPHPNWEPKDLSRWESLKAYQTTLTDRLLTDDRMREIGFWERFDTFPKERRKERMYYFLELALLIRCDGEERWMSPQDRSRIKDRKKAIKERLKRFGQKVLDATRLRLKESRTLEEEKLNQLNHHKRSYYPSITTLGDEYKILHGIKHQARENYVEIFTGVGLSILFNRLFGTFLYYDAGVVALVMAGKLTPHGKTDYKAMHDSVRLEMDRLMHSAQKS